MPVKRRQGKRRTDPAAELLAWHYVFEAGHDFLADAERLLGVADEKAVLAEAPAAWRRVGRRWMDTAWEPSQRRPLPWAWTEFGPPEGDGR